MKLELQVAANQLLGLLLGPKCRFSAGVVQALKYSATSPVPHYVITGSISTFRITKLV